MTSREQHSDRLRLLAPGSRSASGPGKVGGQLVSLRHVPGVRRFDAEPVRQQPEQPVNGLGGVLAGSHPPRPVRRPFPGVRSHDRTLARSGPPQMITAAADGERGEVAGWVGVHHDAAYVTECLAQLHRGAKLPPQISRRSACRASASWATGPETLAGGWWLDQAKIRYRLALERRCGICQRKPNVCDP